MQRIRNLLLILSFCYPSVSFSRQAVEDEFLALVPGGKVSFDMIVDLGFRFSDSAKLLKVNLEGENIPLLRSRAQLVEQLDSSISQLSDKNAQANPTAATINSIQQIDFSWQKAFTTGTFVETSMASRKADVGLPAGFGGGSIPPYETEVSIAVRQSLWKNAFGSSFDRAVEAGAAERDFIRLTYDKDLGNWLLTLHRLYVRAWFAQKQVSFAASRIRTQKRLLETIELLKQRGTAVEADYLNVKQNLLQIEQATAVARQQLGDIWRRLVILLKLPEKFLDANAEKIPLELKLYRNQLKDLCSVTTRDSILSDGNARFAPAIARIKSLQLTLSNLHDNRKSDIYVAAQVGGNEIDDDYGKTVQNSLSLKNPDYSVSVGISMDLGQSSKVADIVAQKQALNATKHQLSDSRAETRILWQNTCQNIKQLNTNRRLLVDIRRMNNQRRQLEEDRFSLGKTDVQSVISASNDLIANQESIAGIDSQLAESYWILKELRGDSKEFVELAVSESKLRMK
ncbi:MAG: TolC family protein [Pseudobacteriovorax sp.]|nr:TolC family protein [Pseudobacteriovorax sp.]